MRKLPPKFCTPKYFFYSMAQIKAFQKFCQGVLESPTQRNEIKCWSGGERRKEGQQKRAIRCTTFSKSRSSVSFICNGAR